MNSALIPGRNFLFILLLLHNSPQKITLRYHQIKSLFRPILKIFRKIILPKRQIVIIFHKIASIFHKIAFI